MADAIVVTGASGFVGGALTAHLAGRGFAVRALSRAGDGPDLPGVTHVRYELTAPPPAAAFEGARAVIHAAVAEHGPGHGPDPNALGARAVLDAARAAGAKPVFLSSFSAHEDALSSYGRSKLALERLFDAPGDVVLKLGLVVGDGGVFARMRDAARGRAVLPVPGAGRPIQVVAVEDVCAAAERVVRDDLAGTFWVAAVDAVPMRELYRALAEPRTRLVPIPLAPLHLAARAARRLRVPLPFTVDNVEGLMRLRAHPVEGDLARLGLEPRTFADVVPSSERSPMPASPVDAVLRRLQEPRLAGLDPDTSDVLEVHRHVLAGKPVMRAVFAEFYDRCVEIDRQHGSGDGMRIEIGAGSSLFSERYPDVVATDIKPHPHLDRVLDAQAMDLEDGSVRTVYGINCFHHLPEPMAFFGELDRVLVPGGTCVLIEPYHGPLASAFYARLFETEDFDKTQATWEDSGRSIMRGANQALSYIVFDRDRALFEQRCPTLEVVVEEQLTNWPRYLLSGGLNFRQLVPSRAEPLLHRLERLLAPTSRWLALHHVVALRKRPR